jgi:hypothetical protein
MDMDTPNSLGESGSDTDLSSIDVDALMSEVESGGAATPDSAPAGQAGGASPKIPQQPAPPAGASPQELEFTWNGKQIKVPVTDPRAVQWLGQGYDYQQKIAAFKAEQEQFAKQRAELDPLKQRYAELEAYVEQNPEWWNHVTQQWEQAKGAQQQPGQPSIDPNHPIARELQSLKAQIGDVLKFKQDSETQKLMQQREQEDRTLNEEIQSIRDSYKDLDWNSAGADGKGMELQVLEYAKSRGISNFKDAFLSFNHDRLIQRARAQGKEDVVKERQKHTKLGLLGETQAPRKGQITHAEDFKHKTYDDLIREGADELGVEFG